MLCRDKFQNNLAEQFGISARLRQWDILSCTSLLLDLELEKVIRDSDIETKKTIYIYVYVIKVPRYLFSQLIYLVVRVGRSIDALKEPMKRLMNTAQVM